MKRKATKFPIYCHPLRSVLIYLNNKCNNPKNKSFPSFGGKGISLHQQWIEHPRSFVEWGIEKGWNPKSCIHRKDQSGDFTPENCIFILKSDRKFYSGKNVGKVFGTWEITSRVKNERLCNCSCIHCGFFSRIHYTNVISIKCAQCKCKK